MKWDLLSILPRDLQGSAICLERLGVNGFAWTRPNALRVLDILLRDERALIGRRAVIGGDVYYQYDGCMEPAYVNWHCEPRVGESLREFVHRSIEDAMEDIQRVSVPKGKTAIFRFVFGEVL
ncbi:MAG: hypothetical protein HN909_08130 [Phycisphaerales bacterium]|nr:hypothetical protein [Phycisphaerales bacterium]MBT7171723.1 hypothetical protein [Phycisphaerales bacterium]